jgi:hypothetical protein
MARLYTITVPGLEVRSDWRVVHDRLLDEFPKVSDVLPTTTPETLLIVYRGRAEVDDWLDVVSEGVLLRRMRGRRRADSASPAVTDPPVPQIRPGRAFRHDQHARFTGRRHARR